MLFNSGVAVHLFTLTFKDQNLEKEFQKDTYEKNLPHIRISLALGFLLYALFGILDHWIIPETETFAWVIRYYIVCPLLVIVFSVTYINVRYRLMYILLSFVGFIGGIGIVAMILGARLWGSFLYYVGLLLCLMFYYTFFPFTLSSRNDFIMVTFLDLRG